MMTEQIGGWEVVATTGRGAFGTLHSVHRQGAPGRQGGTLLRLTPAIGRDFAIRGRLLHIWGVLRALKHPYIARILDVVEESDLSLVLEDFPSGTLDLRLQQGPVPPDQVLAWAQQAAAALAAAHARGVIHRDLHPDNIFLQDGEIRLAGFGIALAVQEAGLVEEGFLTGSPAWLAPELYEGRPPTPAVDVYSLGLCMHRALAGTLAFRPPERTAGSRRVFVPEIPDVRRFCSSDAPRLLDRLADAIRACTQRDPLARPADGAALLQILLQPGDPRSERMSILLSGAAEGIAATGDLEASAEPSMEYTPPALPESPYALPEAASLPRDPVIAMPADALEHPALRLAASSIDEEHNYRAMIAIPPARPPEAEPARPASLFTAAPLAVAPPLAADPSPVTVAPPLLAADPPPPAAAPPLDAEPPPAAAPPVAVTPPAAAPPLIAADPPPADPPPVADPPVPPLSAGEGALPEPAERGDVLLEPVMSRPVVIAKVSRPPPPPGIHIGQDAPERKKRPEERPRKPSPLVSFSNLAFLAGALLFGSVVLCLGVWVVSREPAVPASPEPLSVQQGTIPAPAPTPAATPEATPDAAPDATPDATPDAAPDAAPGATPGATPPTTPAASSTNAGAKPSGGQPPKSAKSPATPAGSGNPWGAAPAPAVQPQAGGNPWSSAPTQVKLSIGAKKAEGVELYLDGRKLGFAPRSEAVSPGAHTVRWVKAGEVDLTCTVQVPERDHSVNVNPARPSCP